MAIFLKNTSLQFLLMNVRGNSPLASSGHLSWLCAFPTFCAPPANLLGYRVGKEKSLMPDKHCSAIAKTLVCYQCCFSHKSKWQQYGPAMRKINSVPTRPSKIYKVIIITNVMITDLPTHACNLFPENTCICTKLSLKVSII